MKRILSLTLLLFTFACQPYKDIVIDPFAPKFVTFDQTRMYFNNVRATYYDIIPHKQSSETTTIYRYDKSVIDSTKAIIQLHIVSIPTKDNAFIMLAPNQFFKGYQHFTVHWKNTDTNQIGEIRYKQGGMPDQFLFATEVYNLLNKEDIEYEITFGDSRTPFLTTIQERNAFRLTLVDFYRLVTLL
ncbi:hypothetical protein [Flammeovirga kamogawensis]|uniref:Uncharacterized protein n=1 Tax=Flammeovirga kamogawensis TaxID=373891 RepID=A0ABX8GUD3_9BACT|nr:hypothetical protein [Flammeovirga kamogawensis]MBB6459746.1 hypothetical protein [Flammeovirga kamogawensis]QWG07195.1 hypothetical protein KM029_18115 [Flammeovirga kamogawensis]TRX69015.1 hypothetical protein EO216_13105 [Flammeovirga kamogawensis]